MSPLFAWLYRAAVIVALALYALAGFNGWRWGTGDRETIPPSVRSSPGGYRSYHFWHTGFMGGK